MSLGKAHKSVSEQHLRQEMRTLRLQTSARMQSRDNPFGFEPRFEPMWHFRFKVWVRVSGVGFRVSGVGFRA